MKVHYINILLFAVPLNILVNTNKKPSITPRHIQTNRLLCECELYMSNYDNDPEMKRVMQQFHDRTTQRFQEYDEKLKEKRQICKDTCDKVIQKIILKDKIEKELTEKFCALHTDIQSDAIPSCICEKSLADKVEKCCLKCGYGLGGALTSWEILGYTGIYGWANFASTAATKAATEAGMAATIEGLKKVYGLVELLGSKITTMVTTENFNKPMELLEVVKKLGSTICNVSLENDPLFCFAIEASPKSVLLPTGQAGQAGALEFSKLMGEKAVEISGTTSNFSNFMIFSGITILVIVLVMVIIYLILRYRRKKNMKKKLQYIKLLKE
ncbi:hypothetical protein PFFVO_06123 [Plasmodium falciparum Vietnam Oak-Knoll (FVO)]|uniref:Surface antigen n=1 Tax=Plasmodium falciparum Vietnam Oak-Knoll (FVO) TaxID=1036723 RepID=A0A024UVZ0_PLAFA|nr:hypothetical protein PFFVO_06123 [Plasmodium falciparum Vietnam Oak-Knoll (FVO)]